MSDFCGVAAIFRCVLKLQAGHSGLEYFLLELGHLDVRLARRLGEGARRTALERTTLGRAVRRMVP